MCDPDECQIEEDSARSRFVAGVEARVAETDARARLQYDNALRAAQNAIEMRQKARAVREQLARDPAQGELRRTGFESLPTPAAVVGRAGKVLTVNPAWRAWFGLVLAPASDFFTGWEAVGGGQAVPGIVRTVIRDRTGADMEVDLPGGRRVVVQVAPMASGVGAALVMVLDATEQYRQAQHLLYEATHDSLTGLANRDFLAAAIEDALAARRRYGQRFGLLYLDLDLFKPVNDTYGHPAGDRLLQDLAQRWAALVRAPDILARVGGDEFMVLVSQVDTEDAMQQIADRLSQALRAPFKVDHSEISLSVSVGAIEPRPESTVEEAIAAADHAMYANKSRRHH